MLVVLILGSPSDKAWSDQITQVLDQYAIPWEVRIASAHKTPQHLLELLARYEADPRRKVYITVAGRSNALSGFVDAQVVAPVIACPPASDKFGGADIYSSLRMPSGVAPAVVLEPGNAALLAAKMLGLGDDDLRARIRQGQEEQRRRLLDADVVETTAATQARSFFYRRGNYSGQVLFNRRERRDRREKRGEVCYTA